MDPINPMLEAATNNPTEDSTESAQDVSSHSCKSSTTSLWYVDKCFDIVFNSIFTSSEPILGFVSLQEAIEDRDSPAKKAKTEKKKSTKSKKKNRLQDYKDKLANVISEATKEKNEDRSRQNDTVNADKQIETVIYQCVSDKKQSGGELETAKDKDATEADSEKVEQDQNAGETELRKQSGTFRSGGANRNSLIKSPNGDKNTKLDKNSVANILEVRRSPRKNTNGAMHPKVTRSKRIDNETRSPKTNNSKLVTPTKKATPKKRVTRSGSRNSDHSTKFYADQVTDDEEANDPKYEKLRQMLESDDSADDWKPEPPKPKRTLDWIESDKEEEDDSKVILNNKKTIKPSKKKKNPNKNKRVLNWVDSDDETANDSNEDFPKHVPAKIKSSKVKHSKTEHKLDINTNTDVADDIKAGPSKGQTILDFEDSDGEDDSANESTNSTDSDESDDDSEDDKDEIEELESDMRELEQLDHVEQRDLEVINDVLNHGKIEKMFMTGTESEDEFVKEVMEEQRKHRTFRAKGFDRLGEYEKRKLVNCLIRSQ